MTTMMRLKSTERTLASLISRRCRQQQQQQTHRRRLTMYDSKSKTTTTTKTKTTTRNSSPKLLQQSQSSIAIITKTPPHSRCFTSSPISTTNAVNKSPSPISLSSSSSTNTYYHDDDDGDGDSGGIENGAMEWSKMEQEMVRAQMYGVTGSNVSYNRLLSNLDHSLANLTEMELHSSSTHSSSNSNNNNNSVTPQNLTLAMRKVANLQYKLGNLHSSLQTQKRILHNLTSLLPNPSDDCEEVSKTMHEIGRIHLRLDNYAESQRWLESALEMKRRLYNGDGDGVSETGVFRHLEIGKTMNALALLHFYFLSSSRDDDEEGDGDDDESIDEVLLLTHEAECHYRYHGTFTPTGPSSSSDDEDPATLHNRNHPDLAAIHENVAMLHRRRRDLSSALERYEEALRIRQKLRNDKVAEEAEAEAAEENTRIVGLLMDIADCLGGGSQGGLERYGDALEKYREALDVHGAMVRRERIEANKNNITTNDDDDDDANTYSTTNTTALTKPHTAGVEVGTSVEGVLRHNIANVHAQRGELDEALHQYDIALSIKKSLVGEDHPEVALTLNAIGALMASNRDNAPSSLPYFREALRIYRFCARPGIGRGDGDEDGVWAVDGGGGVEDERVAKTLENIRLVEKTLGMGMSGMGNGSRF